MPTFRLQHAHFPLSEELRQWFVEHGLYAAGADFTDLPEGSTGSSLLKRVYLADQGIYGMEQLNRLTFVSIEEQGVPVGVALWFHQDSPPVLEVKNVPAKSNMKSKHYLPVVYGGVLMTYLKPGYRSQGWMKEALNHLYPQVEQLALSAKDQGASFVLSSTGATTALVDHWALPLTHCLSFCQPDRQSQGFRQDVWRELTSYADREYPVEDQWKVSPQDLPQTSSAPLIDRIKSKRKTQEKKQQKKPSASASAFK